VRLARIVLALAAAAAVLVPAVSALSGSRDRRSTVARPPSIHAVEYGRYRPEGADRAYTALRIAARDPNGQVVALKVVNAKTGGTLWADGGCGLGGKRRGDRTVFTLPLRLSPGRYDLRVTADSSSCDRRRIVEATTSEFRIFVRRQRG
jgi:hypothetical protein